MDQATTAYLSSVSGYPTGTTVTYWQAANGGISEASPTSGGVPYFQFSNDLIYIQFHIPPSASGSYTLSFTVSTNSGGGGATSTFTFPINVVQITPISTGQDPSSYPAIPGLSVWQGCMVNTTCATSATGGGSYWAANSFPIGGCDGTVCYYDGTRVWENIASYTNDTSWLADAQSTDQFYCFSPSLGSLAIGGAQSGYTIFPHGYARIAATSGDTRNLTCLLSFVLSAPGDPYGGGGYVKSGGLIDGTYIRETAYSLDVYNVLESAGYPRVYWTGGAFPQLGPAPSGSVDMAERTTTFLIEQLSEDVDGINARVFAKQPFMDGLAMEALIQRWQITHDPRIPYVVKREIDDLYANWYDSTNHTLFYNTGSDGPGCSLNSFWFSSANSSLCGTRAAGASVTAKVLNNLYSPAYAWYWRVCGGCGSYQSEGDDLFEHATDNSTSSGKEFSQLFRWSFDYVRWRSGR